MKTLPDYLRKGMKLVIVGTNPTESSVRAGHYYAGRGNPFWPLLFDSGVVPEPFDYPDDRRIIEFGIGLTDLVKRPTKTIEELKREDYAEGRFVLSQEARGIPARAWSPSTANFLTNSLPSANASTDCRRSLLYGAPRVRLADHD